MISGQQRETGQGVLPRWARAADWIALVCALLAAVVFFSGGFRTHVGDIHVTVTSPFRLLIAALLVTIARHAVVRTTPVHEAFAARLRRWSREPGVRAAVAVAVATRPAMWLIGYLAVFLFGYEQGTAPLRVSDSELLNLPVRWDAGWYLQIVTDGYQYMRGPAELQQNIVFFPAFPALIKFVGLLFGNRQLSYVLAAVVVSVAAWIGALVYLYALAREFVTDDEARFTLWLIGAYPFALFFGGIYTESLFLLAAAGAVYHFTRREWLRAAAWGFVAGLSRPNGCFLAIVLGVLAVTPLLLPIAAGGRPAVRDGRGTAGGRWLDLPALAAAAAPGIGVLVYSAWLWWFTGDPLAWAEGHVAWGREYTGLGAVVTERYEVISRAGFFTYAANRPYDFLNALGVIFVVVSAWPVYRRLGLAYAIFILINILPPIAAGGLVSAGRFSSVLFPAFIWFATWVPERHRAGWIAAFAALQALDATLFYTWRPLY